MSYSIAILDRENHNVASNILWFPETIGGAKKMLSVFMDETRPANADQSARLSRLAKRLLVDFPLESNSEKNSLWNGINPIHTVRDLPWQAWTIQIDSDQSDAFLRRLLPLARELRLDVFDLETETYYCHDMLRSYVIPEEKTAMWYELDPIAANPVKYTKAKVAKRFAEQLTPALAEYGFVPVREKLKDGFLFYFERDIEGGNQTIWALPSGRAGEVSTDISFSINSYRYGQFRHNFRSWLKGSSLDEGFDQEEWKFILFKLRSVRGLCTGWSNSSSYCRSAEEINWMFEDTIKFGIPILDKAQSIQGINWLLSDEEAKNVYPENYYNCKEWKLSYSRLQLFAYMRWAGSSSFDFIAAEQMKNEQDQVLTHDSLKIKEIIKFCSEHLFLVGDGPA